MIKCFNFGHHAEQFDLSQDSKPEGLIIAITHRCRQE